MDKLFKIGTLADSLSDDAIAHNLWMQNVWIPYDTFNKVPANTVQFINTSFTDTMPGFTPYHKRLDLFQDPNFAVNMINAFPDIANPTKDFIVQSVQQLIPQQDPELRDASFNLLRDYYAQVLITCYYSDPDCLKISDTGARLKLAVGKAFANYQSALKQWNDSRATQSKTWIATVLGSALSLIPFVGNTLSQVITGVFGSLSSAKLTLPNGNTLKVGDSGLAVDLSTTTAGTLQTLLFVGIGAGVLLLIFANKKPTRKK